MSIVTSYETSRVSLIFQTEETPKLEQRTPDLSTVSKSVDKIISNSPVIASRVTRKRSKRRIFRSVDSLAVTNNEDININVQVETSVISDANCVAQDDGTNAAISHPSLKNALKDGEPKVLNKNQDTCNNEESENFMNAIPDSLNTSTQEFFNNASFSKIDELCSDTFDNSETMETSATRHNERNTKDIDRGRNVEEDKNISFFTARGASINVSKQALLKARRLFADVFDTDEVQSYESFTTRNSNEEKNRGLPSSSFANNVSADITKETLSKPKPLTEQLKSYDKVHTTDCKKPLVNKSPSEKVNIPILFSTASGNPINISKEALLKAKTLLADDLDNADGDELIKYYEKSSTERNPMTVKNMILPSSAISSKSVNISKKSSKVRTLFADQLDTTVEFTSKIKSISDEQRDINTSNIEFRTARDLCDIPVNFEKVDSKAKALFAEHLDDTLKTVVAEKTNIHENKMKEELEIKMSNIRFQSTSSAVDISEERSKAKISFEQLDHQPEPVITKSNKIDNKVENSQEVKIPSIGFQTARGTTINISKQALARAKALFADQLDCPLEMDILENTGYNDDQKVEKQGLTIPYGGLQTASGQQVPVSNNAALIARELPNDCLDESNSDLGRASLQKRKLSETNVDESTPQGRNRAFETKKARLSSEFQARKLFPGNPSVDTDNDENRDPDVKKQAPFVADSILESPKRDAVEPTESDATGSPVIGRQPISRKRKSLGQQKDERSASRADKRILNNENIASQENFVRENTACGKIEGDSTETQKPTQIVEEEARSSNTELNYGDTQMMMDFIDESTKILKDRLAAALEQEAIITAKRRHGSKQSVGHLYRYKQINSNARLSLREIANGAPPVPRSHQELVDRRISPRILEITAATAATYRFRCSDFYGSDVACNNVHGIEMEDGVRLILDENGYAGVWEFLRAFLAGPGVDPNLVPARWVENHYRWIVWKLASMDRMKFGSAELPRYNITTSVCKSSLS